MVGMASRGSTELVAPPVRTPAAPAPDAQLGAPPAAPAPDAQLVGGSPVRTPVRAPPAALAACCAPRRQLAPPTS
eukprot:5874053-Pyramimonas_sp.AAC.1